MTLHEIKCNVRRLAQMRGIARINNNHFIDLVSRLARRYIELYPFAANVDKLEPYDYAFCIAHALQNALALEKDFTGEE